MRSLPGDGGYYSDLVAGHVGRLEVVITMLFLVVQ